MLTRLLLAWSFVALALIEGPLGSGGFYLTTIGGFSDVRDCQQAASWVRDAAKARGRVVLTSECYRAVSP